MPGASPDVVCQRGQGLPQLYITLHITLAAAAAAAAAALRGVDAVDAILRAGRLRLACQAAMPGEQQPALPSLPPALDLRSS